MILASRRQLVILFLVGCFILSSVPNALCRSAAPTIYVAGDGSGDFNCDGKDDHVQINQALKFVVENSKSGYTTVYLKGPFTYVIDDTLLIGSNTILEGDSSAVIKLVDHAGWSTMKPLIQQMSSLGNNDITVRGFEVDGNYAGNSEITLGRGYYNVFYFTYCNNVKIYNMYMHDGMGDGLRINKGKNVQFYNNIIYKLGHDGLFAISCENVEAWNNRITCRTNSALRIWNSNKVKLHDNVIDSFYHWSAGGPGIQIEKSDGVMDDIEIWNNIIHNTYGPGIWIYNYDTSSTTRDQGKNVHIHHNIFYTTGTNPGITWVGDIVASGFHDTLIENNVFDSIYHAAVMHMFSPEYSPKGGFTTIVRNNIIVNTQKRSKDPSGTGYAVINYLPNTHSFILENNCLYNNLAGNYKSCTSKTDIYLNPLFEDQKNHDYSLKSRAGRWNGEGWVINSVNSPCIDAGYSLSDYSNEPEPNGNRINIGPDGNTKYASKSYVSAPILPSADFSSNVISDYTPLTVRFTDFSENTTLRIWNFGDGTGSTQQNPVHTYPAAGNYIVTLKVSNENGTDSKTVVTDVSESNTISIASSKIYDNRLREAIPESVFSDKEFLDLGATRGSGRYRDVILFDLSEYMDTTQINNATLYLFWYYPTNSRPNDTVIEVYRPASVWNSKYVSWNQRDKNAYWKNPGGDWYDKNGILQGETPYATLTLKASSLPNSKYCELNVTELVGEYVSGRYENTGFLIKAKDESENYIAFYSAECGSTNYIPRLELA
jgi:PKD repeat protein